jgi:RimJ/RimL family protein N-acetyltransferase
VTPNQLPIETPSLLLRHFVLDDAAAALLLSNEAGSRTWLPSQVYRDHDHAVSALAFLIKHYPTPGNPKYGPYVLAVEHRASGALIGHVGFSPLDEDVEIGFSIAEDYQGQGLATEAIVAASRWALEAFDLDRIVAVTAAANHASKRTLARARFAHTEDKPMNFQGVVTDVSVFALTAERAHPRDS